MKNNKLPKKANDKNLEIVKDKKTDLSVTKQKSQGYLLQLFSNWATILGFFTSLFFAGYAIYLAIELDRTDKKVVLLENLIVRMDSIFVELSSQSKIQNEQLQAFKNQYLLSENKSIIEKKKDLLEYKKLIEESEEFAKSQIYGSISQDWFYRIDKLREFSQIVKIIKSNSLVLSTPDHKVLWEEFEKKIKVFSESNDGYRMSDTNTIEIDGKLITYSEYLNRLMERFKNDYNKTLKISNDYAKKWESENLK